MKLYTLSDNIQFRVQEHEYYKCVYEISDALKGGVPPYDPLNISMRYGKYNELIKKFINIFKANFTNQQTREMLYRLRTLKIVDQHKKLKNTKSVIQLGFYNSIDNVVYMNHYDREKIETDTKTVFFHELLHMASTRSTSLGFITGLQVPGVIGMVLNEGYTEYLTEKYFTRGMKYTDVDDYRIRLVKGIENIVGSENMENYYFEANIGNLVKDLAMDFPIRDILKLLFMLDHINKPSFSRKKYHQLIEVIADMNQVRLDRLLEEGVITPEEYDIQRAIKVTEYRAKNLWSEETQVSKDGNCFVLYDQGNHSDLYEFSTKRRSERITKKYEY